MPFKACDQMRWGCLDSGATRKGEREEEGKSGEERREERREGERRPQNSFGFTKTKRSGR